MSTVMLNDEGAHQKAGGWKRKDQRQPIRHVERPIHRRDGREIKPYGRDELKKAKPKAGFLERYDRRAQGRPRFCLHSGFYHSVGLNTTETHHYAAPMVRHSVVLPLRCSSQGKSNDQEIYRCRVSRSPSVSRMEPCHGKQGHRRENRGNPGGNGKGNARKTDQGRSAG